MPVNDVDENPLTKMLRPYVADLKRDAVNGNNDAAQTIKWYQMHCSCPRDPGAPVVCEEMFKAWLTSRHSFT